MAEISHLRLKRANLASKSDIANFVNKTDFGNKLKDITSNKNELNEQVKAISTKRLTKCLIFLMERNNFCRNISKLFAIHNR